MTEDTVVVGGEGGEGVERRGAGSGGIDERGDVSRPGGRRQPALERPGSVTGVGMVSWVGY